MLWRALGHIREGFYIDVGAWSPDKDSVTKAFYDRGWRGINVEPNPLLHAELARNRTRDINLKVAIGAHPGKAVMNFVDNSGLSTLSDAVAARHRAAGRGMNRSEVDVLSLQDIFSAHVPDGQPIHFLKIDVEGMEGDIIRGFPWSRIRPWVLVIEATEPMSQEATHASWEPSLTGADYVFAYWDGLNRFYVAQEHASLALKFSAPPNVFDGFELAQSALLNERVQVLQMQLDRVSDELSKAVTQSDERRRSLEVVADELSKAAAQADERRRILGRLQLDWEELSRRLKASQDRVHALEASISWRATQPLRRLLSFFPAVWRQSLSGLRVMAVSGLRRPRLVAAVHAVLGLVPPLHRWAMRRVDLLVQGHVRKWGAMPGQVRASTVPVTSSDLLSAKAYFLVVDAVQGAVTVDQALARLRAELSDLRRN